MKLGEAMYKAEAGAEAAEAAPGGGASGDGATDAGETVVDADFEEVRDDDKRAG